MSKLTEMGILSPQLAYRFRVRATSRWLTEYEHTIFTSQVISTGIDYLNKTLTLTIRQDAHCTLLHEAIIKMFAQEFVIIHVDSLNGVDADPNYILEFDCKAKSHDFAFDYEERDVALHRIIFDFENMVPYNKKEEQNEEVE